LALRDACGYQRSHCPVWDLFIHVIASYVPLVGIAAMDDDKEVHQLAEDTLELPALLQALVVGFAALRGLALVKESSEREAARHNKKVISSFLSTFHHGAWGGPKL
jgi:hypothetical protein